MHTKSIKQLSTLLQNKEISAVALATHFLDRIAADNSNAFLHVDRALTLAQAADADARIAAGTATFRRLPANPRTQRRNFAVGRAWTRCRPPPTSGISFVVSAGRPEGRMPRPAPWHPLLS